MTGNRRQWALLAAALLVAIGGVTYRLWPTTSGGASTSASSSASSSSTSASSASSASASASSATPRAATPGATSSVSSSASSSAAPQFGGLPDTKQRMLLGTFTSLSGQPNTEAAIEQQEAAMGRRYDLQLTYYNWDDQFPDSGEATIAAHGRTPLMSWYGPGKDASDHRSLADVNDGSQDAWITKQAKAIKAFGHPIYLRLMPEMNGTWYHGFSGDPSAYIKAWQHIYRLFAQAGATNVTWVWCPNNGPADWDRYYPGNAYVDIIGVDAFSNVRYGYQSFADMLTPFLAHFAGRRPLMIVETATNSGVGEESVGIGSAASFISGMQDYLKDTGGPKYDVVGICWFNTNNTDGIDWRVNQTPASWQAWLTLARDPYFGGHG